MQNHALVSKHTKSKKVSKKSFVWKLYPHILVWHACFLLNFWMLDICFSSLLLIYESKRFSRQTIVSIKIQINLKSKKYIFFPTFFYRIISKLTLDIPVGWVLVVNCNGIHSLETQCKFRFWECFSPLTSEELIEILLRTCQVFYTSI